MGKRYGFMIKKEDRVLNIGDRIIERGRTVVYTITEILLEDEFYRGIGVIDDKVKIISFDKASKTKRNPQLVIVATGKEFNDNVQTALKKAKIKYELGYGGRGRTDITRFFVEEKDLQTARETIENYYKNGEDLTPKAIVEEETTQFGFDPLEIPMTQRRGIG
jgi:hypothetical protein